ncbi:MAG: glycosyl hydrolase [Candidatus Eisenbacteria bacterium]
MHRRLGTRLLRSAAAWLSLALVAPAWAYTNVKVNTFANFPEECTIAVHPINPNIVLGGAQATGSRYYLSTNGGASWGDNLLPGQFNLGDPALTFDADGNAYFAYIGTFNHSGIYVNKSTDGGLTWKANATPVIEHASGAPFEDKEWPVCDWNTGARHGWLYIAWTQFDDYGSADPADSSRILFARSTNGGASFGAPVRISDRGGDAVDSDNTVEGCMPAVGVDGTIYCAWAGPRGIEFDRSTNGGVSFGVDRVISDQPGGWDFPIPGIYRCNGLPVTKVDLSNGPHRGRVYVHWADKRNGDYDCFLIYSDNGGTTWSARKRINDDPLGNGKDQFFSWIDVDPTTGTVYAVFYDRRGQSGVATDVYFAYSQDGGDHWVNEKVSATPFTPNESVFFGDYIGISAFAGRIRTLWMRLDGNDLSLWTALIDRTTEAPPTIELPLAGTWLASGLLVAPNPIRFGAQIRAVRSEFSPQAAVVADVTGRVVRRLPFDGARSVRWDGRSAEGMTVAAGVYFVSADGGPATRVVIVR